MKLRNPLWLFAALLLCLLRPAGAHPMPQSAVLLDIHPTGVSVELHLPLSELEVGFGHPLLTDDPAQRIALLRPALSAYIVKHLSATAPDGRLWQTEVREVTLGPDELPQYYVRPVKFLLARVWLAPPPGAPTRRFTLHYDAVVHQLVTHVALVSVRQDWDGGVLAGSPVMLGEARWYRSSFPVDLSPGSPWRGFLSIVHLGMQHIAEGTDHLLFLLALLLPASLTACGGRWGAAASVRQCVWRLLKVVTGFTVGHSCTLVAGSLGWFHVPEQPIEVLIAVSILVSAVHALRPLFPGREAYVAAGFGLIHGMSFASVLSGFHLDAWRMAQCIFGFNLGIELMQLIVVGLTVPWLILLARTPAYTPFRLVSGVGAGVAALGWMCERALGWKNPIGTVVDQAAAHALWIVVGLAALSVGSAFWDRICRADLEEASEETAPEELEPVTLLPSSPVGTSR